MQVMTTAFDRQGRDPVMSSTRSECVEQALATSQNMFRSPRMFEAADTSAMAGRVTYDPVKSVWIGTMTAPALIAGPATFTWGAFALFIVTTAVTICLGHSLGMHRRLIHRSLVSEVQILLDRNFNFRA